MCAHINNRNGPRAQEQTEASWAEAWWGRKRLAKGPVGTDAPPTDTGYREGQAWGQWWGKGTSVTLLTIKIDFFKKRSQLCESVMEHA